MVPMQKVQIKKDDACWAPVVQKVFLHDELGMSAQSWVSHAGDAYHWIAYCASVGE